MKELQANNIVILLSICVAKKIISIESAKECLTELLKATHDKNATYSQGVFDILLSLLDHMHKEREHIFMGVNN